MLIAAIAIGGLGLIAALALGFVAKVFYVEVDPVVARIEESLPGANCGGCGQPGCAGAAAAIAKGKIPPNACVAGGAAVGKIIAGILGVEVKEAEPQKAQVGCRYPVSRADIKFDYAGITDCRAAVVLSQGPKECPVGCIGLGSCVKACPFDALSIGRDHLPVVDLDKCTGCGTCVRTCPMGIMHLTSITDRILHEYSWEECTAPCQRRCPAGIDIPKQIYHTALGNYSKALEVIKERNPLPLICGRICPNPCENVCRRNLEDDPVAINPLKRFVADWERNSGKRVQAFRAPLTEKKIAVIGGGVEGLSAAYFLARLGHAPKIFEGREQLGGLLRTAISPSRLPREVLDWEISGILDMGVEAETGKLFGGNLNLNQLFDQGFDTVLFTVGGWDALLSPGHDVCPTPALSGLNLLLPLKMAWLKGREVKLGSQTALIGCGGSLLNMAKQCLQHGADDVTVLCPGELKELGVTPQVAVQYEAQGIRIVPGARVTGLTGIGDRLTGLTYENGREDRYEIKVDSVVAAAGRVPDMIIAREKDTPGEGQTAESDMKAGSQASWRSHMPYPPEKRPTDMFRQAENPSDHWAVVEAIGAGRRAAASIHALLNGLPISVPLVDIGRSEQRYALESLQNLLPAKSRQAMPVISDADRYDATREIELGLSEQQARTEASRCLNCGLICYYRTKYH